MVTKVIKVAIESNILFAAFVYNKVFAQYQNCTNDQYDLPIIAAVVTWSPEYFVTNDKGFKEEEVQKHVKMASVSELLTIFRADPGQAR